LHLAKNTKLLAPLKILTLLGVAHLKGGNRKDANNEGNQNHQKTQKQ
jgi:hypothetical protein